MPDPYIPERSRRTEEQGVAALKVLRGDCRTGHPSTEETKLANKAASVAAVLLDAESPYLKWFTNNDQIINGTADVETRTIYLRAGLGPELTASVAAHETYHACAPKEFLLDEENAHKLQAAVMLALEGEQVLAGRPEWVENFPHGCKGAYAGVARPGAYLVYMDRDGQLVCKWNTIRGDLAELGQVAWYGDAVL